MRRWLIAGAVIAAVAIGIFLARGKLFTRGGAEVPELETAVVRRGDITVVVEATGTVEPLKIVEVKSKASGEIIRMPVEEGDTLKKGDLIAEIEKTYVQADVDQAEADLKAAKARLEQAKINLELQKKLYEIEVRQAEENLRAAQARLEKLQKEIELEKESHRRELEEARNNLEAARLQLKLAKEPRLEEIKRAEANVEQAKANLQLARAEYERIKALYEKGFVPKSELDAAESKLQTAQAQYESALQQLEMVKNPSREDEIKLAELNVRKAELALKAVQERIESEEARQKEIEQAMAQLEEARLALEQAKAKRDQIALREKEVESAQASVLRAEVALKAARDRLADTVVTAPISGTILKKHVEEGQVIFSSLSAAIAGAGTTIVTMADLSKVYVKVDVDETQIGLVKPGQPVQIVVDAYPDRTFEGTVLRVAPQGEVVQNVTVFKVITEIKNPEGILKPGMNAAVKIIVADKKDVLLVPNEAIRTTSDGRKYVIPVVDGRPGRPIFIETGVTDWEKAEVISGLSEGDVVLVGGFEKLKKPEELPRFRPPGGEMMRTFRFMQGEAQRRRGGLPPGPPPPPR